MKIKSLLTIILLFLCSTMIFSQAQKSLQPHQGKIQSIVESANNTFYTAGDDGFVVKWLPDGTGEHFQISDLEIKLIAVSPNGTDIAVYETDGFSIHRVSEWNWKTLTRKNAKRFTDSIVSLEYSAKGTYLMAGTSSVDGMLFLDPKNKLTPLSVVKDFTGTVTVAKTGKTEKTVLMYSPQGTLTYYNLADGSKVQEFDCETLLEQATLLYNNVYLVGTKNDSISIIKATTGEISATIPSKNPIILKSSGSDLHFVEFDEQNDRFILKQVPLKKSDLQFIPVELQYFTVGNLEEITANLISTQNEIIYGTASGALYSTGIYPSDEGINIDLPKLTETANNKISDIAIIDSNYYFISHNNIYVGKILESEITLFAENVNATNIIALNNDLILWSINDTKPVYQLKINENNTTEIIELFTIQKPITSLNASNEEIVTITGNSTVYVYNFEKNTNEEIYTSSGLQDAILYDSENLYVAKTAVTNPTSALINININTKETVPHPVKGDIMFSLEIQNKNDVKQIYGVSVTTSNGKKTTEIFTYTPTTKSYAPLLQWADEDTSAFVNVINGVIYTNIAKSGARSLNLNTKKSALLKRSASLPKAIVGNKTHLATVNQDGSITWYSTSTNAKLENWNLTAENYLSSF
ncbi:MAG: hypothetical protein IJD23_09875 [Spirochaetaceae bacterium]|nr:hypothetical protein [Spirochaetaceae bacterium]